MNQRTIKRIGITTGGGDCPGLNAVIRAVVLRAAAAEIEVIGIEDGFGGLLAGTEAGTRVLTLREVAPILDRGGTILGTTNRGNPFAFPGPDGAPVDRSAEVVARAHELGIDAVITVGGDGTQRIAHGLDQLGLPVIGVPKTIDNDLAATLETFGFGTAVQVVVDALDRLRTTAESHDRIMLLEVMGRDAGWIALHSGIAGGADVILLPELPYEPAKVAAALTERIAGGHHFALIVVAEGATIRGEGVTTKAVAGATGGRHAPILGGAAHHAAERIAELLPALEYRVTVLGHIQRGGTPTAYDRLLASRLGVEAVEAALRGEHDVLVASFPPAIRTVPLASAVEQVRKVDPAGQLVAHARGLGIAFGD
ncbi:MAG: ATP-dependent 6-phosphofructokinase [Myxococcales bacterium]|nr:ATP-dependent 6-phosphofructokinase [Myxococcales bacterium]MCB9705983.1 ATP-dependent 6-phosphofructokinase [Myxococcales bacterium]